MITGRQIQAARALLGWSQQYLADRAVISRNALSRLEAGKVDPRTSTVQAIRRVLEEAGIEFLSGEGNSEGVRIKRPAKLNEQTESQRRKR